MDSSPGWVSSVTGGISSQQPPRPGQCSVLSATALHCNALYWSVMHPTSNRGDHTVKNLSTLRSESVSPNSCVHKFNRCIFLVRPQVPMTTGGLCVRLWSAQLATGGRPGSASEYQSRSQSEPLEPPEPETRTLQSPRTRPGSLSNNNNSTLRGRGQAKQKASIGWENS